MNEAVRSVFKVSCTALEELLSPNLQSWLVQTVPFTAHSPGKK